MADDKHSGAKRALKMAFFFVIVLAGMPVGSIDWYWFQGAQLDFMQPGGFWGDDIISDAFRWVYNNIFRHAWNYIFGVEAIRVVFALLYAGFLTALGGDLYKLARDKLVD